MSYGPNGANGYTNGYHRQQQSSRYSEDHQDPPPITGRRVRRAGGYGGFFNSDPAEQPEPDTAQGLDNPDPFNASGVPTWRRRDESNNRERSEQNGVSTRLYGDGPGARQIEGVVQHINDKWSILAQNDCVPVHVALQLMDYSSLGRGNDYDDFRDTNKALQQALKAIVNEHHQGFNSSIGTFHKIQSSIQVSQNRVRTLKTSLLHAKETLTIAKPELKGLVASSQDYDEMLQVLSQIEKIQTLPEQLDAWISEKHFLSAVDILQDALRLIRSSNLENIGALADLRVYLNNQETSLIDILIEELHDHIYLKSPYCQDRWKAFTPNITEQSDSTQVTPPSKSIMRPLHQFLNGLNTHTPMTDNISRNPELDSFDFIHMIIEALNRMGRLDLAVDRMEQRLPVELFAVVEKTNHEVDLRHPAHLRNSQQSDLKRSYLELQDDSERQDVLLDLLRTLYSKFEAIAEGHRVTHDVIAGIVHREGLGHENVLLGGFKELWKVYQSEIRSLLHDYLATDGNTLHRSDDVSAAAANLFQRNQRDKTKRVFKFVETDKASAGLVMEQEDLDKILQASVPGLVSKSHRRSGQTLESHHVTFDTPAAGHKLLIEPSVFNISVLLPPSIFFLHRLRDVVPSESDIATSTMTSFLDEFIVNVFNPQLDETVTELCTRTFNELNTFQQDSHWADHSRRPIFKGTSVFFTQITAFCKMLDAVPEDQTFTQLVITQLAAYLDKCSEWYTSLVSRVQVEGGLSHKPAAMITTTGDLEVVVRTIWQGDDSDRERLRRKEVELLTSFTNETPLEPFDIISDRRTVAALCLLYSSMQWLASRLSQLRHILTYSSMSTLDTTGNGQNARWSSVNAANLKNSSLPVRLPMTKELAVTFDGIVAAYRELATRALMTLHVDIRCGIIHILARILKGPYLLDQPSNEPDPNVLSLNADLLSFDDTLTMHLPNSEYHYITQGLSLLLNHVLVTNASQISVININGCGRMLLNILVLQQNIKSIENGGSLSRSALFYEYFQEGADAILKKVKDFGGKDLGFSLEELKVLMELCFSEAMQSQQRDVALQAKKALNDHQLQLSEMMWNT